MGGSDDASNLIELSIEEHAEAHRVLWETHNKKEDFVAWKCLSGFKHECEEERKEIAAEGYRKFLKTNEGLEWISRTHGRKHTEESKQKNRDKHLGKKQSEETKQKNANSQLGKKHSQETINKLKELHSNRSKDVQDKISASVSKALKGKPRSDEVKKKISESLKENYLLKKSKQLVFLQSIKRGDPIDC